LYIVGRRRPASVARIGNRFKHSAAGFACFRRVRAVVATAAAQHRERSLGRRPVTARSILGRRRRSSLCEYTRCRGGSALPGDREVGATSTSALRYCPVLSMRSRVARQHVSQPSLCCPVPGHVPTTTKRVGLSLANSFHCTELHGRTTQSGYYNHIQASLENIPLYEVSVLTRHNCCGCVALLWYGMGILEFNVPLDTSSSSSDRVDSRGPLRQPRVATTTNPGPFSTNAERCTVTDMLDP